MDTRAKPDHRSDSADCLLRNDREAIEREQERLLRAAVAAGYTQASCFALRLATEEAISNAFRHGHKAHPEEPVRLRWSVGAERIRVEIEDRGEGFSPASLPDPTAEENIGKPSGRGIMLMRAYMTRVVFNTAGNHVTMEYAKPSVA